MQCVSTEGLEPIAEHAENFRGVWDDLEQAKEWASSDDEE